MSARYNPPPSGPPPPASTHPPTNRSFSHTLAASLQQRIDAQQPFFAKAATPTPQKLQVVFHIIIGSISEREAGGRNINVEDPINREEDTHDSFDQCNNEIQRQTFFFPDEIQIDLLQYIHTGRQHHVGRFASSTINTDVAILICGMHVIGSQL